VNLKLPSGEFRTSRELEELAVTKQFGILPDVWDEMPVAERERLIGAARDQAAMQQIADMGSEEKAALGAIGGWVKVEKKNGR